ncbi:MAG: chitinase, partial [Rhodoglobus sp.]|nr:chitinase [Rhodoglobus sp.]
MSFVAGASPATAAEGAETDPQLAVYVEVNSNDLANVADYTLADSGRAAVDLAMIFAANINYDGEKAYLHLNDRVTETLQDAENQIRPLQAQGTKVLLSVLGNHQGAGFANF